MEASNLTLCYFKKCANMSKMEILVQDQEFKASMNHIRDDELILCHLQEQPFCRRHNFEGVRAWKALYNLCTGEEFFTG